MAERVPVAVFISGSGTNMAALLYASRAADCPYEIVLVLSNNPDASGLKLAEAEGVATFCLPHKGISRAEHDALMEAEVVKSGARYIALAGYMRILSPEFAARWEGRMLNIHPALLPSYKGLHTHERALADGVKIHGCTVHFVVPEMDSGAIVVQAAVAVRDDDTPDALAARVLAQEHVIYPRALAWLASDRLAVANGRVRLNNASADEAALVAPATT